MSTLNYRADINGLRAIAVLAVVVFHAWPEWLPGGFVGVDVFFVLSGYLISGIIFKGCRTGNFTFTDFYARRVRRIFPSLVAMLVLCLAYGWLVLLPAEFRQLGGHAAWGSVFLQNVAFWLESGYFDTSAALKPLLHLWSLAVEEQVYLVFPPVVLLAWRFRWPMLPLLFVLFVTSLVACLVATRTAPSAAFFLTPFRTWEFLAGSILALMHDRRGSPVARSWRFEAASWCGLGLLAFGLAWIGEGAGFPGWRAAIPVAGTTLMLAAGPAATPNRWLLSLKPLVWIGLISYPLYLFHWPLLSFLHIIEGPKASPWLVTGAVGLSFALATAAYLGLERTIRPSRWTGTVPTLVAAFLVLGGIGLGVANGLIAPKPPSEEARLVEEALAEWPPSGKNSYYVGFRTQGMDGVTRATIGGSGPQTIFFGDSNMYMYAPRIRRLLEGNDETGRGAIFLTRGGASPIPGVEQDDVPHASNLVAAFERELATEPRIDRVVIAAFWPKHLSNWARSTIGGVSTSLPEGRAAALRALTDLIRRCREAGQTVTLVLPIPIGEPLDPQKMLRRNLLGGRTVRTSELSVDTFRNSHRDWIADLEAAALEGGAEVVDPLPAFSRDGMCFASDENGPIRSDANHVRGRFARDHVTFLDHTVADKAGDPRPPVPSPAWKLLTNEGAEARLVPKGDGVMRTEVQRLSNGPAWHVRLVSESMPVEQGMRYIVSLRARSDAPRKMTVLAFESEARSAPLGLARDLELAAEWQHFRFEFTASKSDAAARLRFNLGASDIPVEISDVVFTSANDTSNRSTKTRQTSSPPP
jgi:peptidoglycan/LPS O-acetylase OafA/YrhL